MTRPARLRASAFPWPAGPRESDGVWAPHWYAAVEASTGFAAHDPRPAEVPDRLARKICRGLSVPEL